MGGGREGEVIRTLMVCSVLGCRGIPQAMEGLGSHCWGENMCLLIYGCRAVCLVLWCVVVP